jgi:peroxiredoxin
MNALHHVTLLSCLLLPLTAQEGVKAVPKPDAPAPEAPKQDAPKILQLGQRVPGELTLLDLDGKPVKAHDLMGKITVVNFYSTKCPIQKAWDQRLSDIQKQFEVQGVTFLHIDSNTTEIDQDPTVPDSKPVDALKAHLKDNNLPFRVLLDHGNIAADLFDARTTPHVYVFGKDGRLIYKGLVDDDQKDRNVDKRNNWLRDVLGKLLKDEKVEPFATKEEGCSIKRTKKLAVPMPADAPKAKEAGKGGS